MTQRDTGAVRAHGGLGVVQDPQDAQHPGTPASAIRAAAPEHVVPVARMSALLTQLIGTEAPDPLEIEPEVTRLLATEMAVAELTADLMHDPQRRPGSASGLPGPDCHGALWMALRALLADGAAMDLEDDREGDRLG